ncbi:hypothetical protein LZ198_22720 [Myxococcus sp. K15C18031901]|uniref:hypothetical protein n=1 Tax=Myxococcus dinghuensis TaxID=2906761 RepID=UPI0020A80770|nr:hypothetical protein [Myxococcus dinghuensis]MCP3101696.1 hypothetical protein [Myxococcus dinghuensis]
MSPSSRARTLVRAALLSSLVLVPPLLVGCNKADEGALRTGEVDKDEVSETGDNPSGTLRMKNFGGAWIDFDLRRNVTLDRGAPAELVFWGHNDPIPEAVDDETDITLILQLERSVLGAGPMTLTLDGSVTVPPRHASNTTFVPGPTHTAGVRTAFASISLNCIPPEDAVTQEIRGTLVLTANDDTHLRGHLDLTTRGSTAGCPGGDTESHLDFEVRR